MIKISELTKIFRDRVFEKRAKNHDMTKRFIGELEDIPFQKAPDRMAFPGEMNAEWVMKQWERADWGGVDPRIKRFSALLIERARQQNIPLYVHCARRQPAVQAFLFQNKKSKVAGPKAAHTVGCAVDIVHSRFHWEMTATEWEWIGVQGKKIAAALGIQVQWGGDWGWDMAHWELKDWRQAQVIPNDTTPMQSTPRKLLKDTASVSMASPFAKGAR